MQLTVDPSPTASCSARFNGEGLLYGLVENATVVPGRNGHRKADLGLRLCRNGAGAGPPSLLTWGGIPEDRPRMYRHTRPPYAMGRGSRHR